MKKFKAGLRILFMVLLLVLAAFGVGITANFMNPSRERYLDNEIKIERVDKKEEDEDGEETSRN